MNKRALYKIFLSVLILILAVMTCQLDFTKVRNGNWLLLLCLLLIINFVKAIKEALRGEKIAWDYLSLRDKLVFVFCLTMLLIICLYPIKEEMNIGVILLFVLLGFFLTIYIVKKFGSDALNELFWG